MMFALLLAISISSDKIDTFMHLPDWFPTSVDAEHTFGSDERTNCSHRTTVDTLAAVESVFDAYHERVFYASEGRSNDWDVASYGPRPYESQRMWFTNTVDRRNTCFVYSTWTNEWPRATPDSRRLLEFDNLFGLSSWIPPLFARRTGAPWLDKGDTWGRSRDIMFGSSWGPVETDLPEVGWTDNSSFRPDLASSCVPLCYCATDTVFKTSHPSADGFLWDVLRGLDSDFNALYRIEGGPLPYPVSTNGYLAEWHNGGMWTNSAAAKTSIPGVITNKFPLAGPEAGFTNLTRRLVPDDTFDVVIVTNGYRTISEKTLKKMASECIGLEGKRIYYERRGVPVTAYVYYLSPQNDRLTIGGKATPVDREFEFNPSAYFEFGNPPDGTDRVDVELICEGLTISFSYEASSRDFRSVVENDAEVSVTMKYQRFFIETNYVAKASSLLATESRALAMLDRTYEIPARVAVSNIPETATERDTKRRFTSSLFATGTTEVVLSNLGYPRTSLPEDVYLYDLVSASHPDIRYSTTNVYSQLSHPTVVERRLTGGGVGAEGGFSFGYYGDQMPSSPYTVRSLKQKLSAEFGWEWEIFQGRDIRIEYVYSSPPYFPDTPFEIYMETELGFVYDTLPVRPYDLIPASLRLNVGGNVSVFREASVFVGGVPSLRTLDRMYPWYGPGPYGYADGTVGSSRILFAEEVLAFLENGGYYYPSVEWPDDPISLPFRTSRAELDSRGFEWDSYHRLAVSQPSGGVGSGLSQRVYDETYGPIQAKVDAEFRSRIGGSYDSAEGLIPVSLSMAHYVDVALSGIILSPGDSSVENLTFSVSGPDPTDIVVKDEDGRTLTDDVGLVNAYLEVSLDVRNDVYPVQSYRKHPVAVDGRLSPVIVTDWDWKSLKAQKENQ